MFQIDSYTTILLQITVLDLVGIARKRHSRYGKKKALVGMVRKRLDHVCTSITDCAASHCEAV